MDTVQNKYFVNKVHLMRFEVVTAVKKSVVVLVVMLCAVDLYMGTNISEGRVSSIIKKK
jgi:hypothetical protein